MLFYDLSVGPPLDSNAGVSSGPPNPPRLPLAHAGKTLASTATPPIKHVDDMWLPFRSAHS